MKFEGDRRHVDCSFSVPLPPANTSSESLAVKESREFLVLVTKSSSGIEAVFTGVAFVFTSRTSMK